MSALLHDFLHGVLHLEGKTWQTLPMLVWKPGELTRRYIVGERTRFVAPMTVFLFSVFLMFATLGMIATPVPRERPMQVGDISIAIANDAQVLTRLESERAAAVNARRPVSELDSKITEKRQELESLRNMEGIKTGNPEILKLPQTLERFRGPISHAIRNPELTLYKLRSNAYKWSWALIPISMPLMWLLFPLDRRIRPYHHFVFVTYSLAFMTLLFVTANVASWIGLGSIVSLAIFVPPIHLYSQMKGTYALDTWSALWRTGALSLLAILALATFSLLIVGLSS